MSATRYMRQVPDIGQEVRCRLDEKKPLKVTEYCREFNDKHAGKGVTIDKSFMSRLMNGKGPSNINKRVRAVCEDLDITVEIKEGEGHDLLKEIEKIPSSKRPYVKKILAEVAKISES